MCYRLAELWQIEERHTGKHVMFEVILHVPVVKPDQPRTGEGSCAHVEVGHVRVQSIMLWQSTGESKPVAVERTEGEHHDAKPVATEHERQCNQRVPDQQGPRPVLMRTPHRLRRIRQDVLVPVAVELTLDLLQLAPRCSRIPCQPRRLLRFISWPSCALSMGLRHQLIR